MTSQDARGKTTIQQADKAKSVENNTLMGKIGSGFRLLFFRYTTPTLLILFVSGVLSILSYTSYQQSKLIHSFNAQEEKIYQEIAANRISQQSGLQAHSLLTEHIFNEAKDNLQNNFIILSSSLGLFLIFIIFIIQKLKVNSNQLQVLVDRLQRVNDELHNEISKRDDMAKKLEELNNELKYQSLHDSLTKLPNRRLFEDRIHTIIQASRRNKTIFAIMFIDLDGFKVINDTLGHDVGDELLREVSARFNTAIRSMDTVARLGGDEFALILTELDKPESASIVAERIFELLATPIIVKDHRLNINASIGITIFPYDSDNAQMLLKNADVAMYHAKNLGRGNFQYYREDMNVSSKRELLLRNSFDQALQNSELDLNYQPIVDIEQHAVVHFEALLRWHHAQLGHIPPMEIIRLADHLGLNFVLGEWIIDRACKQLKQWKDEGFNVPTICINTTSLQLESATFIDKLKQALQQYQLDPSSIILEVTESSLIQNTTSIKKIFHELNQLGIKIAIDDFGTGYSSLSYLRQLHIQILKIDRSFIQNLNEDEDSAAIVKSIIALANVLHLDIIAEGVETAEEMKTLRSLGCKKMQGFLFSKPLPAKECLHIVIPSKE